MRKQTRTPSRGSDLRPRKVPGVWSQRVKACQEQCRALSTLIGWLVLLHSGRTFALHATGQITLKTALLLSASSAVLGCSVSISQLDSQGHSHHPCWLPWHAFSTLTSTLLTSPLLSSARLSSALLTSPLLSSAQLISACLTSPHFNSPQLSSPHHCCSHLSSSQLVSAQLSSPHLTAPYLTSLLPQLTSLQLNSPQLTSPHFTSGPLSLP